MQTLDRSRTAKVLAVNLILIFTTLSAVVSAEHPNEDQNFRPVNNTGIDFPVGWDDSSLSGEASVRMIYPAMDDGESKNMAGNGPFPWVVFFGDEDEEISDYMLLGSEIAKHGTIVLVTSGVEEDDSDNIQLHLTQLESLMEFMQQNNNSSDNVQGSFGQIDLNHWGIGGHGTGAAAAYAAYPFWQHSSLESTSQPPRALFGLGIDFSGWSTGQNWDTMRPIGWTIEPASPATGLFMTGTIDEIARGQDNLPMINGTEYLGWQWMHVLGANHYQFQDETDDGLFFGDDRNDGDASISRQQQIDYAMLHLNPYFDLMLRGDHSFFRDAFNRPEAVDVASDQDSYIEENLDSSELLIIENTTVLPENKSQFSTYETFSLESNWTMRDGSNFSQIPNSWQIDVECGINNIQRSTGFLDSNGTAICSYQVEDIEPGIHVAYSRIYVEGAPSTTVFEFTRGNTPLVFMVPLPEILVPERGEAHLSSNLIAMDPDGQEMFVQSATISGGNVNNFSVEVDTDGRGITIYHTVDGEYTGGAEVDVVVRSGGEGVIDENQTTLEIRVIPYNDPVVLTGNVAMQNMIEDGVSVSVNISDYAYDPEGQPLLASINDMTYGQAGPISFLYSNGVLELTPLPDANGATVLHVRVTDGGSEPVDVDIPVQVAAVDDPVIANQSRWNIEMSEDQSMSFNLSEFAYDIDGDQLQWETEIISPDQSVSVIVSGKDMIISPSTDYFGLNQLHWLNVTDGNSNFSKILSINISSVPDAPVLTLNNVNIIDQTAASLAWGIYDADGTESPDPEIKVDDVLLENLTHSCIKDEIDGKYQCVTMLELPSQHGENVTIRVAIIDSEFPSEFVAYTTISFNQTQVEVEVEETADSNELSSSLIIGIVAALVILILILFLFIRSSNNTPIAVVPYAEEEESIVEKELEVDMSSSGLLSRIQQQK